MRDKDDFIIVWCNEQAAPDDIIKSLQSLCNDIHYYQDSVSCISYIESLHPKQHVFLVISPLFTSLEAIHSKRQIDTIFIFQYGSTTLPDAMDTSKYPKAISVLGDLKDLVESIITISRELDKCRQLFNLYNHKQKSLCNLSESSASFLWFQLFKDMLVNLPKNTKHDEHDRITSKKCMIQQCYDYYRHNPTQMKNIKDFDKTYEASNAIRWYTSDSCVYKFINKALRTEDMEVLHTFRFFIVDLCISLAEKHQEMLDLEVDLPSVVYRGAQMIKEEIESLQKNEGCLIATNGFLSTSRNREVAKVYAGSGAMSSKRRGELHAVVFELELPTSLKSFVFADISYMSKMIHEEEILFDIGTTFIVTSVAFDDVNKNWVIRLTGTDKGHDIVTKEYIDFYRKRMVTLTPTIRLGEFLIIVGQYEKARTYFNDLLKLHDQDDVYILYNLAWIDKCQGKYREARGKLDCAYEKENTNDSPCQQKLRDILNDIGTLYVVMDEHEQALNYYQQAMNISSNSAILNNIGLAYKIQGRFNEALEYFDKAHEASNREWPNGHYEIGITLDNIGQTYNYQGEYSKALDYHLQALHVKQKTLPDDHMDIGISFNNVGFTYNNLGECDEALTYYQRALQVYQQCLPEIHLETAILLDNMATVYYCQKQYKKGLEYLYKALHIEERVEPISRLTLGRTLNNLGVTLMAHKHNDEDNDDEAFDCFRRALTMYDANGSAQSSDAAISLYQQGKLHHRRKEYNHAHQLYEQALIIQRSVLPKNHSATLKTQATLTQLKIELESNDKPDIPP